MSSKNDFKVSRWQLKELVERAGKDAVEAALIQNGSAPNDSPVFNVSRRQLSKLIERADDDAVKKALIQNGSAPSEM